MKRKKEPHIVYPFTFCPPGELNDPLGVPFGCRQPFCIGIGVADFVAIDTGGVGSIVGL